ncbi:dihydrolipoamide acetyltransferase family protein [Kineosporia sp. A_224]|uniref:dihydrolipoamide acetyltransferase family protein n=1 Tax=Kineosporia sp. A_224 TaxID=1962180 RepID=UPI000B4AAB4C|nr:dihydrolipoamide acetyltransferase family protein [Kineosporia sp. A_224]
MADTRQADIKHFRLPDAGEGLTEADIVQWKVAVGDTVKVNDPIVEIETAKSLVELPCPFAGVVTALLVAEGATVEVGTPIIAVDTAPGGPEPAPATEPVTGANGRTAVLVGYGPRTTSAARRPRRAAAALQQSVTVAPDTVAARPESVAAQPESVAAQPAPAHALAKPPVRLLAKQLGVDLTTLAPSGPGGVVTREDVEQAARPTGTASGVATHHVTAHQVTTVERETRIPVKGVRRLTADAMVTSAFTAPHVTEWVQVDVSRTMKLVGRLRADRAFEGVKVSPLLVVAKALLVAVQRHPGVNAAWDEASREIVVKHYVNLGIAAATPRGLVVPNVKDADRLGLRDLAVALNALAATAREGRTPPADLAGGTVTITNVGVFGVDAGTPILNPGEAAILAVGQIRRMPWVHKGKVRPRWVTTLALSFDHRMVDGDLGSRALAEVAAVLEDPVRALW